MRTFRFSGRRRTVQPSKKRHHRRSVATGGSSLFVRLRSSVNRSTSLPHATGRKRVLPKMPPRAARKEIPMQHAVCLFCSSSKQGQKDCGMRQEDQPESRVARPASETIHHMRRGQSQRCLCNPDKESVCVQVQDPSTPMKYIWRKPRRQDTHTRHQKRSRVWTTGSGVPVLTLQDFGTDLRWYQS